MPDDLDDDELDPNEPPNIRQLRKQNKQLKTDLDALKETHAKAERLEWEIAVRDADLNLDPLQRKALLSVHEGERTADAIKETATKLGFAAPPPAVPEVPAEELARLQRINAASAGASPMSDLSPDKQAERDTRLRQATSEKDFDSILREYGTPMVR